MFKVGDRVKIKTSCSDRNWYTKDYYFINKINGCIATLNKSLVGYTNTINIVYLYLDPVREERANKLREICSR